MHALIGEATFCLRVQTRWRHFYIVLEYRDMSDVTESWQNLGYFIK